MTPILGRDLASWIDRWAGHRPDALALEFEGRRQSYSELSSTIESTAAWLHDRGVVEGDRVAWLGPNRPITLELIFACSRLGAMLLPLNSRLAVAEHEWILGDAEPRLVLADPHFADHAAAASDGRALVIEDDDVLSGPTPAPRVGTTTHPLLLAYTSGTTGRPKGAVLDQAAMWANATNAAHAHDFTSADRVLTLLPLFHVGGLNIQTLPALAAGAAVLLHRSFDPGLFLDDVERWQPTWSLLVPTTLTAVAQHPRFATTDFGSLTGLMTGSSTVPDAVTRPYFDRGIHVGQVYGSTETAPTAIHIRVDAVAEHPGSCGKPSTTCVVRVVDDDGNDVAPGRSGELWVRGPNVLREYWRNPAATSAALTDGWYHTGDIGHVDDDGWFFIDDRKKDVIISGGENIYPAELENVLGDHPDLAEYTVVGRPDERWGDVPVIVAVAAAATPPDAAAVLGCFDGRLARFKHPKAVIWVDALPRNAMGKVLKHEVRDLLDAADATDH
jgi:fatty-acyl-CoA synthase